MCKIIWITGISGTGKTTLAKHYMKFLKNFLWIDGDQFRKLFNDDLGYTLKDRNKNAERLINFVYFLNKQKISVIVSANLTAKKNKKRIKRKFKNIFHIQINSDLKILKKRDKKNIYKKNKNVVGKDIKFFKSFNKYDFLINNNNSKKEFIKRGNIILKKIRLAWA
tara:strand:+ start:218 stop:715 length:498 start_codon:yes stop_codon:yes gene_type:complete